MEGSVYAVDVCLRNEDKVVLIFTTLSTDLTYLEKSQGMSQKYAKNMELQLKFEECENFIAFHSLSETILLLT